MAETQLVALVVLQEQLLLEELVTHVHHIVNRMMNWNI